MEKFPRARVVLKILSLTLLPTQLNEINKGGSKHNNWCMARVLSFLIRHFSNYYTLHRSDLAARAAPLDPRLFQVQRKTGDWLANKNVIFFCFHFIFACCSVTQITQIYNRLYIIHISFIKITLFRGILMVLSILADF